MSDGQRANDGSDKSEVPWSWRFWIDLFNVLMVIAALFVVAIVVWFFAHPAGHLAADIVQRWDNGWQEGLNDGPD